MIPRHATRLMRALADEGIPAAAAVDGLDGLRLARTFQPSIIFLDVIMPQPDGWKVLAALKADPALAAVPVVMVTLSPTEDLGYLLGATDYLMKPLDHDRLSHVLRRLGSLREQGSVLVIDDDDATRTALRKLLSREGWTVKEAENGRAGLEQLATSPTSLIILDLILPEMDGFEFLAALRRQPAWRALPVLVMTSKDLTHDDRLRLAGTAQSVISKGAHTRDEVLREVRDIAHRRVLGLRAGRPSASFRLEPTDRYAENSDS